MLTWLTRRRPDLNAKIVTESAGLLLPCLLALSLASPLAAQAGPREDFLAAEAAFTRGERAGFDALEQARVNNLGEKRQ